MLPTLIEAAELAIKYGPAFILELKTLFTQETVTPEDWEAFKTKVSAEDYFKFVPASDLIPPSTK